MDALAKMSFLLTNASTLALGIATLVYLAYTLTRKSNIGGYATLVAWLGCVGLTLALVFRWIVSGHAPFASQYEYALSFGWGIVLSYLYIEKKYKTRMLGLFVMPVGFLMLLYALSIPSDIEPLVPALQNNLLLTIHVSVAIIAYGTFAVAFGCGLIYLLQGESNRISWLPSTTVLDEISYNAVIVGFPLFGLVIILGAYWGNIAWGRYWGWDPKETASLVTWLIFAAYLHSRNTAGWRGRPSVIILIVGFLATLFTFFGVNLFLSGLHSYAS